MAQFISPGAERRWLISIIFVMITFLAIPMLSGCGDDSSTSPPVLSIETTALTVPIGETTVALVIANGGAGSLEWSLQSDVPWLAPATASGSTSSTEQVILTITRAAVPVGEQSARVTVSSNGGDKIVTVSLEVPLLVSPAELIFPEITVAADLILSNSGSDSLNWIAATDAAWLTLSPVSGGFREGNDSVRVELDRTALEVGSHQGSILIDAGAGGWDSIHVNVDIEPNGLLTGMVFYPQTRIPIEGATVSIGGQTDLTDAEGRYTFSGVSEGDWQLTIEKTDFTTLTSQISMTAAGLVVDYELATDSHVFTVVGNVYNSLSEPVRRVDVTLINAGGSATEITYKTDTEGRFTLQGVPEGGQRLECTHPYFENLLVNLWVSEDLDQQVLTVDASVLSPPEGMLTLERIDCITVEIQWHERTEETLTGYLIERSVSSAGPYEIVEQVLDPAADRYRETGLELGIHTYRISSLNIDEDQSEPSTPVGIKFHPWADVVYGSLLDPGDKWGHFSIYDPVGDRILATCGIDCTSGTCGAYNDVWEMDMTDYSWTRINVGGHGESGVPAARRNFAAVHDQDRARILIHGGVNQDLGESPHGDMWAYDIAANAWSKILYSSVAPSPRCYHSVIQVNDELIFYGGKGLGGFNNDVWKYNIQTRAWQLLWIGSTIPTDGIPLARYEHAACYDPFSNRMIIHGGSWSYETKLRDTWAFDLTTHTWEQLTDGFADLRGHQLYPDLTNNRVLVVGMDEGYKLHHSAMDLSDHSWSLMTPAQDETLPGGRIHFSMTYLPEHGGLLIFGGTGAGMWADTWINCTVE
jgi:Carboxypeptidase regulatory-like domain/Viral BACON domain/Galactose oxidase, central domain